MLKNLNKSANSRTKSKTFKSLIIFFLLYIFILFWVEKHKHSYGTFIHSIHSTILSSFIHTALYVAVVTYSYKTSNGNTFYHGNGYDSSDIGSILLDAVLSVAVVKVSQQMAAALLKVQCRVEVAPRSVASPVAWAVQSLQGWWVMLALPEGTRQKPPPLAVPA
jgi:hypothetical protein